jgi:hypothetical protein
MRLGAIALGILVSTAIAAPARADEPPAWARGVTDAQKAAAKVLLDDGNSRFVEHDYVAALEKYRAAIAQWDHPAIRFNVVRCLIQLDRPLEADDELTHALAYGAAPLEDSVYSEAIAYQKLLANQIGHLRMRCGQPGVELTLDGHHAIACPGSADERVTPGTHQIVGTRAGYVPHTDTLVVLGGAHEEATIVLVALSRSGGQMEHRWATWKPWVVVGASVGVAALGALIDFQASRDMQSYDAQLVAACHDTGCSPTRPIPPSLVELQNSARHESELGVSLLGVGAATAIVGGALLYLNRDRVVYPSEHLDIAPQRGGAAVMLRGSF